MKTQTAVALIVVGAIAYETGIEPRLSHTLAMPLHPHTEISLNSEPVVATTAVISVSGAQIGYQLHIIRTHTIERDRLLYQVVDLVAVGPSGERLLSRNRIFEEVEDFLHAEATPAIFKDGPIWRTLQNKGTVPLTGNQSHWREEQLVRLGMKHG
jgi:hypothetical protein